jgi:hypothetical protein
VGALQLHGSVYVLPATSEAREDLEWIAEEVVGSGGQATIFVAEITEPAARDRVVEAFRKERAGEYEALRVEAERAAASARTKAGRSGRSVSDARLRERLAALAANDFFGAPGRDEAESAVAALEPGQEDDMTTRDSALAGDSRLQARDFRGREWVTRPRPGIDRMSTAWLVRRFIDPAATFRFVDPERRAEVAPAAVPFDMYGVELGHQRGGCTFETVARRFAIEDPAVARLARIVHQLDLKTGEPTMPDAAVIGQMVEGLRRLYADDRELLERGIVMFEALYQSESERRSTAPAKPAKKVAKPAKKVARPAKKLARKSAKKKAAVPPRKSGAGAKQRTARRSS